MKLRRTVTVTLERIVEVEVVVDQYRDEDGSWTEMSPGFLLSPTGRRVSEVQLSPSEEREAIETAARDFGADCGEDDMRGDR